jgi:hypothetical protein
MAEVDAAEVDMANDDAAAEVGTCLTVGTRGAEHAQHRAWGNDDTAVTDGRR